jgi:enamine deaminase RidA (YjgF/YER057c/UK114 family)
MKIVSIEPQPNSYAQGALVTGAGRWVYVSGQVPEDGEGRVPATFGEQARLAWRNVFGVLERAGMTPRDLVKVTVYLSDRRYREENAVIRAEMLGDHAPALTVVIVGIWDEAWLLEIEAVAAAPV